VRASDFLKSRRLRLLATLVVTGLAALYIVTKIDIGKTARIIGSADRGWLTLSVLLTVGTVPPQAWRWQWLLRARGIRESVRWLTRAYFVSYAVGQVLPTSVGGDASRIFETVRRHPGQASPIAGSVLIERAIGAAVTLALAAVGLALAIGRYDIGAYYWIEALFVVLTVLAGIVFFSRRLRGLLRTCVPFLRRLRIDRFVRAAYEGIHGYRNHVGTLFGVSVVTACAQLARCLAIWASGKAVGIDLAVLPYIVLGPLLFLVMLVPFTLNGLAVREAFFVSFLGKIGVAADEAFACGFLFFVMTLMLSAPGLAVILWEGARRGPASVADG
jgi:uncharacterized protein (TIRG00374 family)